MFDTLVDESNLKSKLLVFVTIFATILLVAGFCVSLFAKDYHFSFNDDSFTLKVSEVVTDTVKPQLAKKADNPSPTIPRVKNIIQPLTQTPVDVPVVSTSPLTEKPVSGPVIINPNANTGNNTGSSTGSENGNAPTGNASVVIPEPVVIQTPEPTPRPTPTPTPRPSMVSGGVVNGFAISLPSPPYPASARALRLSGRVVVSVIIDEQGNIDSASVVSGHPLLSAGIIPYVKMAKFTPTKLSGVAVKVSGQIVYNFTN